MQQENGKITYRQLTITNEQAAQIANFLGFNEDGKNWYVYRIPHLGFKHKQRFENANMQAYMPTYTAPKKVHGKTILTEQPKILNYIFVLATPKQVNDFLATEEIYPLQRHRCEGEIFNEKDRWQTIPPTQMHSLMIVAQGYEKEIEFCTPDDQLLEKGDKVRVVDGRFKGVEGILIKNQGSRKGGRIYVEIARTFGTHTVAIPDEHIQVLEFSKVNNHFHNKIKAVEKLLNEVCLRKEQGDQPLPEQQAALQFFLFRYANLSNLTFVSEAKLTACRYTALHLLNRPIEADLCIQKYHELQQQSKASRRAARRSPSAARYMESWNERIQKIAQT